MSVTLTIPTLGRINLTFMDMLHSLDNQTFKDFKAIFIVPLDYQELRLNMILEETDLEFSIVHQTNNGFENAMNCALRSSSDINLNMDDDAIYPLSHVRTYIQLFEETNAGIIFGKVNGRSSYLNKTLFFLEMQYLLNNKPLASSLKNYLVFFNSAGFLSGNILSLQTPFRRGLRLNGSPIGVNMGWSKHAVKNFSLLEFSKRGTINEAYIALHVIMNGMSVIETNLLNVKHNHIGESLSRENNKKSFLEKLTELLFTPLVVQTYYHIDQREFEKALTKIHTISNFIPLQTFGFFNSVLAVVSGGIFESWDERRIRKEYNNIVKKIYTE